MTPDLIPHAPESAVVVTTAEAALVVEAGRKMAARLGLEFVVDAEKLAVFEAAGRRTPLPTLAPSGDEVVELRERVKVLEKALWPFEAFADGNVNADGWSGREQNARISTWFGPSDFHRARAALSQHQKGDPQRIAEATRDCCNSSTSEKL